jgi:hypothetical protein
MANEMAKISFAAIIQAVFSIAGEGPALLNIQSKAEEQ